MKYIIKSKIVAPSIITFIVVIIFFIVFIGKLTFISVPDEYTEVISNIPAETSIYANTLGIPHIISDDDNAMFFALGYFHARERLFSMQQAKIISQGRMAEHYGSEYIDIDIFMRAFRIDSIADKCYQNADNRTQIILKYYADGVNQYVADNKNRLPIEFAAANFIPDEWRPKDCFVMARYWSFVLSNNIFTDIAASNIVNKLGLKGLELYPKYPENAPYILDDKILQFKEDTIRLIDTILVDTIFDIASFNTEMPKQVQNDNASSTYYDEFTSASLLTRGLAPVLNTKFGGQPLKFGGQPLKFGGQPLNFGGNPLKLGGTTTEFYRNPLKFGGNPPNISGNKTHYYNLNENNNVLLSNLTRGLAPVIDFARNNKDFARNGNVFARIYNVFARIYNVFARDDNKNNHPVSAIALPPLHRGELFPSCGGVGVVNARDNIENVISKLYDILNRQGANLGSNSWAVSSENGNIVLASDSHLPINLNPYWMPVHLTSPSYNVIGICLPGMPICLMGRNDNISWGNANMLIDDIDYFVHKFKDDSKTEYLNSKTEYSKIASLVDTLKVKGALDYYFYQDFIDGNAVLKDKYIIDLKENTLFPNNNQNTKDASNYLTYNWTGSYVSNEIGAILDVMKGRDWKDFIAGVNNWHSPGLVFTYADIKGNIGAAPRGLIPIRAKDLDPRIVNPYWKYENTWIGFIRPSEIPTSYNPTKQFVFTANNNISRELNSYVASSYSLESRAKRFYELATNISEYTFRDAQIGQNDIISVYAKDLIKKIAPALKHYNNLLTKNENIAHKILLDWNYAMDKKSVGASIFAMFLSKIIENTFADELGDLYDLYIHNPNIPMQKLLQLCSEPTSEWFNNVQTKDRTEHLNYIVITSFKDAIAELTKLYHTDNINKWEYGKFHTAHYIRSYNYFPSLNIYTDIGKVSIGGCIGTLNCGEWSLSSPFNVNVATTMRFISDMSSDYCYAIISRGISDNAMSLHSSNQHNLFNIGEYNTLSISRSVDNMFKLEVKFVKK